MSNEGTKQNSNPQANDETEPKRRGRKADVPKIDNLAALTSFVQDFTQSKADPVPPRGYSRGGFNKDTWAAILDMPSDSLATMAATCVMALAEISSKGGEKGKRAEGFIKMTQQFLSQAINIATENRQLQAYNNLADALNIPGRKANESIDDFGKRVMASRSAKA